MKFWRIVIQTAGLVTVVLSFWGFYCLADSFRRELAHPVQIAEAPFFRTVFFIMNSVDFVFLAAMSLTAVGLLKVSRRAVSVYSWIYLALIVYVFAPGAFWGSGSIGRSTAAASGVGDFGIAPLVFFPIPFVYGVASVAAVNLAIKQLRASEEVSA